MADRKTIQIPVDVQLKIKDQSKAMRGVSEEMQDIFANADPGTAFYKSLSKAIVAIEKKLNSADSLLGKEFFSEADLGKTTTLLGGVADILSEISTLAKRTSTIGLGFETDELIQANEALKALQATIRSTKKNTKVGAVSGMLDREEVKRMVASSKDTGFSAGKTFDENQAAMAKSLGKVTEEYVRFQQEAAAAAEIAEKAGKAVAASKVELNMAKGELQTRKDLNTNLAKQIADVKVSGQGATKENIAKQYQDVLLKQLTSVDGEKYAPIIAGWLDISEAELIGTATDIARNLEKAINTAMATGPAAKNKLRINAKSVIDGKAAAFQKDRIYGETEQKVAVATANVDTAEEAAKEAVSNLQAANNTVTQTSNLLATIQSQMAELKKLQAEYNALVDEQHANELNALKTKQQDADYKSREGERIFNKNVKNAQGEAKSGYDIYDQQQINRRIGEEQDRLEKEAARESQEFTDNLKQSIRHWMSAQQVINMVKDGIRQAYQDIKGLDTAMTNIAVVTDMSVSDLWGKINDYMSIAQQYGVTTQGVYEVSQLYYQQGLSTNEVMAATTETLKMARIAGMDYAEAADAMTVAIRAFKMEMTDAEHVTDVYSKVAAVTASDSEELAIAMSKTASSAESVGSSFENTTAMLAVMIETTRESAQNLGSALKSIISRYGEMKVGLSVDSEGEEIDYNKVDTALKSVGISIKDAQGQFRDFDDVIFELSAKWDSLDKNTQRYIATIMAGNRQQSRFIALVDNWERLDEVATSAQDSEDAGLLQYAKTLDSLDTKLNNLKTSFQSFYMSIFNGEFFKGAVDLANNLVQSFSRLGPLLGSINLLQLINQIKIIGQLIVQSLSGGLSKITKAKNEWQKEFTNGWESVGDRIGDIIANAIQKSAEEGAKKASNAANGSVTNSSTQQGQTSIQPTKAQAALAAVTNLTQGGVALSSSALRPILGTFSTEYKNEAARILNDPNASDIDKKWATSIEEAGIKFKQAIIGAGEEEKRAAQEEYIKEVAAADEAAQKLKQGASQASQELSGWQKIQKWGSTKTGQNVSRAAYTVGTLATSAGMMMDQSTMAGYDASSWLQGLGGAATAAGQFITGDVVGGVITAITTASSVIKRIVDRDKVELENLEKAATEANVERAKAKENATNLEQTINNLRDLEKARYESEEANQAFLDASKAAAEAFPELAQRMDESGQMIVDVSSNATNAERLLYEARQKSAEAAIAASAAELEANAKKSENTQKEVDKYSAETVFNHRLGLNYDTFVSTEYGAVSETLNVPQQVLANLLGATFRDYSFEQNGTMYEPGSDQAQAFFGFLSNQGVTFDPNMSMEETVAWLVNELSKQDSALSKAVEQFGNEYTSIIDRLTNWLKEGNIIDKENGTIDDWLGKYNTAYQANYEQDIKTQASLRAAVITEAEADYLSLERNAPNEWINEVSTSRNMMWNMIWDTAGIVLTNTDYVENNKLTERAKTQIENTTKDIEALWDDYYGTNLANIDELNEIITASIKGTMSAGDAAAEFKRLSAGGGTQKVETAYIQSFYENDARYRAMYLQGAGATIEQGYGSLEEYRKLEGKANSGADEYLNDLRDHIKGINDGRLLDFLMEGAIQDVAEYVKINSEIQKAMKTTGDGFGATALQKRDQLVKAVFAATEDENSTFFDTIEGNAEAYAEFMKIFTTDIGTSEWAEKLQTFMDKYDMKWEDLGVEGLTATSAVFENYQIRLQADMESAIAVNEKVNELFSKQEKGFSWDESQALLKEYQKASDESNVSWANLFEVNEEGAIVLKDISKVLDTLYQSEIDTLGAHSQEIQNIRTSIGDFTTNIGKVFRNYKNIIVKDNEANAMAMARDINEALNGILDEEQLGQLASAIYSGAIKSYTDLVNFYTNLLNDTNAANEAASKAYNAMLHENYFSEWGKKFDKGQSALSLATSADSYDDLKELFTPIDPTTIETLNKDGSAAWDQYYEEQLTAAKQHGISLDTFGNLVIKDWIKWGKYIAKTKGYMENSDEYKAIMAQARATAMKQAESQASSLEEGLIGLYENIFNGEVLFEDIEALFTNAGITLTNGDIDQIIALQNAVKDGNINFALNILQAIINKVSKGINYDLSVIEAAKADAARSATSGIIDIINQGADGTLSAVDLDATLSQLQIEKADFTKYVTTTQQGMEISAEGLLAMASQAVDLYGELPGIAEELVESLKDTETLNSYEAVSKAAQQLLNKGKAMTEEDKRQLSLLQQMKAVYSQLSTDKQFNFMDVDNMDGQLDNFVKFTENIKKGVDLINTAFTKGEKVSYVEFKELLEFMQSQGITKLGKNGVLIEDFALALAEASDILGNVDLATVAANLKIDMADMGKAFDDGLNEVARAQIEYWSQYRDYLVALKGIEDLEGGTINTAGFTVVTPPTELKNGKWLFNGTEHDSYDDARKAYAEHVWKQVNNLVASDTSPTNTTSAQNQNLKKGGKSFQAVSADEGNALGNTNVNNGNVVKILKESFGIELTGDYNPQNINDARLDLLTSAYNAIVTAGQADGNPLSATQFNNKLILPPNTVTVIADGSSISTATLDPSFTKTALSSIFTPGANENSYTYEMKGGVTLNATVLPDGSIKLSGTNLKGEALSEDDIIAALKTDPKLSGLASGAEGLGWSYTDTSTKISGIIPVSIKIDKPTLADESKGVLDTSALDAEFTAEKGWTKTTTEGKVIYTNKDGIIIELNTNTKDIVINAPKNIDDTELQNIHAIITGLGYSQVEGKGAVYSPNNSVLTFSIATKTEDIKAKPVEKVDSSGMIPEGNTLTDTSGLVWTKNGNGSIYTAEWNGISLELDIAAGTLKAIPKEGTKLDATSVNDILTKALGEPSTEGIYTTVVDGKEVQLSISAAGIKVLNADGTEVDVSNFSASIPTQTVDVILNPVTSALDTTITEYENKTVTIDVEFKPGSGSKPKGITDNNNYKGLTTAPNGNLFEEDGYTPSEDTLFAWNNLLNDAYEMSDFTEEDFSALQSLAHTLFSPAGEHANFGNNPLTQAVTQLDTLREFKENSFAPISSLLTQLSNGNLLITLPALSAFMTAVNQNAGVELNFSDAINDLKNIELSEDDVTVIVSMANAISALGAAWATLPATDTDLTVSVKDNATAVIRRIQGALDSLKDKVVKIDVENDEKPLTIKVSFIPKLDPGLWTGNVNDLGSALADGNVTKLLAGASFTNKTLVGELGPELAVYNGRYHLLGRNGAEFVNLPSDAIVFNHKQTEGIVKGQTHIRGKALAEGNVSGPALASGDLNSAIAAVDNIIAVWQGILEASVQSLLNAGNGGGGGGGGGAQAPTAELQEWYNLSREIARLEQEINNTLAKRKNLTNGREYLRSLKEQQAYLKDQLYTQKQLYDYQEKQLERQKNEINNNKVWSQFLIVDENGLRYRNGNETNGGKGALDILAALNDKKTVSAQFNQIWKYGFRYKDDKGNTVNSKSSEEDKAAAVQAFFDQLQGQIDAYDALYDTVQATEQAMAELEASINEIEQEILQNTMDLEEAIYDIIVENAERAIEKLEEYTEKLGEANEAYINGLKESLNAEKEQYEKEKSDEELSQLQRRLNLLRRTGGSATEIADLEKQLNEALKEQYFNEQEKLIEELEKTNEEQIEKLEQQITIQQETLEYQKEAGLIWNEVAEIMSGSEQEVKNWFETNNFNLLSQSANQLAESIENFAHMIEMYKEYTEKWKPAHDKAQSDAEGKWEGEKGEDSKGRPTYTAGEVWNNSSNPELVSQLYGTLNDKQKESVQDIYSHTYADSITAGDDEETALRKATEAAEEMVNTFTGGTWKNNNTGKEKRYYYKFRLFNENNELLGTEVYQKMGNKDEKGNYKTTDKEALEEAVKYRIKEYYSQNADNPEKRKRNIEEAITNVGKHPNKDAPDALKANYKKWYNAYKNTLENAYKVYYGYSQGGLVDYTGPAMVHGTPSKPEAFLNAKQTAMISNAVRAAGEGNVLDGIRTTLASLDSSIRSLVTNNITTQSSNITVAPGAVVLNVAKLNDSYDIEELSNDIMNRMVNIASKATNRGVNRR